MVGFYKRFTGLAGGFAAGGTAARKRQGRSEGASEARRAPLVPLAFSGLFFHPESFIRSLFWRLRRRGHSGTGGLGRRLGTSLPTWHGGTEDQGELVSSLAR